MNSLWLVEEQARNTRGLCSSGAVVGLPVTITRGVGEGSIEHYDIILVLSTMVLDSDSGCVIWLRFDDDDGCLQWEERKMVVVVGRKRGGGRECV